MKTSSVIFFLLITILGLNAYGVDSGYDDLRKYFASSVTIKGSGFSGFSGVMISPRHILTAAHCVLNSKFSPLIHDGFNLQPITLQNSELEKSIKIKVSNVFAHPSTSRNNFSTSMAVRNDKGEILEFKSLPLKLHNFSDLAIIELSQPLDIPVAEISKIPFKSMDKVRAGGGGPAHLGRINYFNTKVMDIFENIFSVEIGVNKNTGSKMRLIPGDSGGAIINNSGKIIGINSFRVKDPVTGGYAARVDSNFTRNWINYILEQEPGKINFKELSRVEKRNIDTRFLDIISTFESYNLMQTFLAKVQVDYETFLQFSEQKIHDLLLRNDFYMTNYEAEKAELAKEMFKVVGTSRARLCKNILPSE